MVQGPEGPTMENRMTIRDIAHDLVALCKQGKFEEAGEKYWADDVLSVEPMGDNPELRGKAAVRGKSEWWAANHEVHSAEVGGPYVNGDQFVVRFTMDMTIKASGERRTMDEVGLYTIRNGKIAEERFFYGE
jgi:ketosteroid isomerase-like protein